MPSWTTSGCQCRRRPTPAPRRAAGGEARQGVAGAANGRRGVHRSLEGQAGRGQGRPSAHPGPPEGPLLRVRARPRGRSSHAAAPGNLGRASSRWPFRRTGTKRASRVMDRRSDALARAREQVRRERPRYTTRGVNAWRSGHLSQPVANSSAASLLGRDGAEEDTLGAAVGSLRSRSLVGQGNRALGSGRPPRSRWYPRWRWRCRRGGRHCPRPWPERHGRRRSSANGDPAMPRTSPTRRWSRPVRSDRRRRLR
jgi:hypothetical protein